MKCLFCDSPILHEVFEQLLQVLDPTQCMDCAVRLFQPLQELARILILLRHGSDLYRYIV